MNNEAIQRMREPAAWVLLAAVIAQMLAGVFRWFSSGDFAAALMGSSSAFYGPVTVLTVLAAVYAVVGGPQKSPKALPVTFTALVLLGVGGLLGVVNLIAAWFGAGSPAGAFAHVLATLGQLAILGVAVFLLYQAFNDRTLVPRPEPGHAPAPGGQAPPAATGAHASYSSYAGMDPSQQGVQGYSTGGQQAAYGQAQGYQTGAYAGYGQADPSQTGQGYQGGYADPSQQGVQGYSTGGQQAAYGQAQGYQTGAYAGYGQADPSQTGQGYQGGYADPSQSGHGYPGGYGQHQQTGAGYPHTGQYPSAYQSGEQAHSAHYPPAAGYGQNPAGSAGQQPYGQYQQSGYGRQGYAAQSGYGWYEQQGGAGTGGQDAAARSGYAASGGQPSYGAASDDEATMVQGANPLSADEATIVQRPGANPADEATIVQSPGPNPVDEATLVQGTHPNPVVSPDQTGEGYQRREDPMELPQGWYRDEDRR